MRKFGFYVAIVFALVFSACSSGGEDTSSDGGTTNNTTITAVDGYIKDATLKDATGQVATYSGSGGKYTFSSTPTYPLTLTGGKYEDTNASFDINMTCNSGTVISPITTFLENNATVLAKLANLNLSGNPSTYEEFAIDFIDTNNSDLAKLNQLLYVVLQDENLTKKLKNDMNATSLADLYTHIESDINATITTNITKQNNLRALVRKIKDINATVAVDRYENELKSYKVILNFRSSRSIKKTGQTQSYDASGNVVTDGSIKDDGYYQKGVTPQYTRASDIVTDELTGLMWQDDADAGSVQKPWLTQTNYDICTGSNGQTQDTSKCYDTSGDTADTYCSELSLGGYTDWRLPTSTELEGIVDYGKIYPSIDTSYFYNVSSSYYWSSTTAVGYEGNAWIVYFYNGSVNYRNKFTNYYVRCVRAGQ